MALAGAFAFAFAFALAFVGALALAFGLGAFSVFSEVSSEVFAAISGPQAQAQLYRLQPQQTHLYL